MHKHYHPFRVASSEQMRHPDGAQDMRFRYRYIVYHCVHYGNPRMRGMFQFFKYLKRMLSS